MAPSTTDVLPPRGMFLCLLVISAGWLSPAQAQRAAKLGGPRGAASVQGLLLAPTEDDKSRIFIQLRHQLTPSDVLTIVQNERSESIAALAVGVYLEKLTVQPREAAQILYALAQHPGLSGLAATLGAASGHAGPIADELAAVDSRVKMASPRALAAELLATYAWMSSHPESPAAEPAVSASSATEGKRAAKRGKHQRAQIRQPTADVTGPLDKLLTAKEPEILESAVLAAAWLRYAGGRAKITALDDARLPGVQAARLLYLVRIGEDVPAELVPKVFARNPPAPARYAELSPALATYDIRTSPWAYGCEALGELRDEKFLTYLHEALNHHDL
ncbi:MAG: hypothetical protein NTY19_22385, partial [Planctomycetota bacterium]|nr:hypothetical protein [Planctomycetota bacterium]